MIPSLRIATFLAPSAYPAYRAISAFIGARLGVETILLTGDTHDQFTALQPDLAFICGLPYVLMRREAAPVEVLAAPVLRGARYGGRPIYFSDVIVRADAPYARFADLRGCRWAYNEEVSQSGYGITRHTLLTMGETRGFFGEVVNVGWHQRAITAILDGRIDAAAIDSQVLSIELEAQPELTGRLRILDTLGPSTIQPVVVRSDLDARLKADLRAALLAVGDDAGTRQSLDAAHFERFVAIDDAAYDDIRAMLAAAEAADFLRLDGAGTPSAGATKG